MQDSNSFENQAIAWTPTPEVIKRSQLMRFMKQVGVSTWDELYAFSIRDVEQFTEEVLKFLDIRFHPPYEKLLDTSNGIEFPQWFSTQRRGDTESVPPAPAHGLTWPSDDNAETRPVGSVSLSEPRAIATGLPAHAGLNITEMCLDRWQTDEMKGKPAVIWEGESGKVENYTYAEMHSFVIQVAESLTKSGFKKGDALGIHLPMIAETINVLLAINRIGAIAVPVFSGYGVEAIASRLNAVGAKALFTAENFPRRGKIVDSLSTAIEAVSHCPSIEKVYVTSCNSEEFDIRSRTDDHRFTSFYDLFKDVVDNPSSEPTAAEDPLIILYTSGTTGKPKGIAHTHASFPIKAAQDMAFGTDVGKGTRICWYTDIGWMMGPWLIYGALINGATICIYDGAPDYPAADRMWEFCAKHKVEVLGISPTLVRSLATCGDDLPKKHDLSSLRILASTGEPWNPAPWWWLFEKVGNSKLPIINYSGGTEIAGGILMGNPLLPIKPGSFPAPCPGMDVDILDENGKSVGAGEVGELVIKQPWIGMARGFWQEKERYLETYWRRFKDIWVHGDWAMRDSDGHWYILGRSDDTLKVAGKRVGPAEVESILVSHPLVTEAAVIGVPDETKGTAMVAFCVIGPTNTSLLPEAEESTNSGLSDELKALVARNMGKPLAPSNIHFVSALPKTRNAKVMRRVIRSAYLGEDPGDLSALENQGTVEEIWNLLNPADQPEHKA